MKKKVEKEVGKNIQEELSSLGIGYDPNEVINLDKDIDVDIVLSSKKSFNFKFLIIIPVATIFLVILLISIILSNHKVVPAAVVGESQSIGTISLVPNNYSLSPSDIKVGSIIIYGENSFVGPFLVSYKKAEVAKFNDMIIYLKQPDTKDLKKINMYEVLYVLK